MPLTTLDTNAALIVIDLQEGIVARPTVHPVATIADHTAKLLKVFRASGLPVVLVNVDGGAPGRTDTKHSFKPPADWATLIPQLDQQRSDHIVTKLQWGAFSGTSLDHFLRRRSVTQLFLAGISTSIGVESTARHAHELGYHVVLVADAMTDMDAEAHRHSIEKIFPRLGEVTTTDEVLLHFNKTSTERAE